MGDRGRVVAPVLIGRERELESLAAAVSSPPAVVTIEGEAGIGKTRLVGELAGSPAVVGRRWLAGASSRIHDPFPLGAVIEALRGAEHELRAVQVSPVVGALRTLLPELSEVLPPELPPLGDHAAERHRVFRALLELLSSLAPLVLVLEDVHWADGQTLEFISYLAARAPADLTLVLTFRSEEVEPSVRASVAKLPSAVRRVELQLRPLDAAQTGALGAAILGTDQISNQFAEHLCARASGIPFAIEELLALLRARGTLVHGREGWSRRALAELDVPSGIRDPVLENVSRLSGPARAVVEAAAVLEVAVPAALLVRASGVPRSSAVWALDEAVASGLLTERAETVGFRHVLAAQAVYDAIPTSRRAELHGRCASMLEELDPVPLGQLAHHFRRAGHDSQWVRAAEAAAEAAAALGHDAEAVRGLEELLREATLDAEERGRIALRLGRASSDSGLPRPDLVDLLSGVANDGMPPPARAELRFWIAMLMQNARADRLVMRNTLVAAVEDLEDRPDLQAWAMVTLGIALPPDIPVAEHRLWLGRALEIAPSIADRDFAVFLLGVSAMSLAYLGDPRWRGLAEQIVERTAGAPSSRRHAAAYLRTAMAACYIGAHDMAASLLSAVRDSANAGEHPRTQSELASIATMVDFCNGSWEGLRARAESLLEALDSLERLDVEVVAACLALAAGDVDAARRQLSELAGELEATGDRSLLAFVTAAVARQAVVTGATEDALDLADRFIAGLESKGLWAPLARPLPAVTQLLLAAGRAPSAHALVALAAEELAGLDQPLAPAALAHARGFIDSARGDSDAAARNFRSAADEYQRMSCLYEAAQAREHAAAALFAADTEAAERELRAALTAYEALGAAWDHARCVRVGRAHGVRLAATHRGGRKGYGDELSPRERQVARLAAEGLSNKAIAAELYLSPHTVAKHVERAKAKLGARSRAAIATRLTQRHGHEQNGQER